MKKYIILLTIYCCSFMVKAELEVLSQLNFGTIAIIDNSQVETYRIYYDGRVTTSDNILIVSQGEPALVRVYNLAANTPIVVSHQITNGTFRSQEANTNTLELTAVSSKVLLTTDEVGELTFGVGGTLATNANNSVFYGSSFLLANFEVTIDY